MPDGLDQLAQMMDRKHKLDELLVWCNQFMNKSKGWRQQSFEAKWSRYQRDADAIYDPQIASNKKPWQSKAFIPLTPSHRETIVAQIYKTMMGVRPILDMKPRGTPANDQSENIRDLILREMEKSRFEIAFNTVLDDSSTYGSGFARIRWEEREEDRKVRKPVFETPSFADPSSFLRSMTGQARVTGYEEAVEPVLVYRGVRIEHISIWDVYPDPNALKIKGNPIACRYPLTYGEVVAGVDRGYFFQEALEALRNVNDDESTSRDSDNVKGDRGIARTTVERPNYGNKNRCYELYAKLPKKWVFVHGEDIDDPEKLVPARVIFHSDVVLAVEINEETYNGEPPIYKMDYWPVSGQFYGRGVPEQLQDIQLVVNETVNQRIDSVCLGMNQGFAVIEKAVVDRKEFNIEPGFLLRLKSSAIQNGDIRNALMPINLANVPQEAYVDPQEMERYAQERTSASKITLGTAGQTQDINDTARGMQLVKEAGDAKFAYIGMTMEFIFMHEVFRGVWNTTYGHISDQDILDALGPERAQTFELLTPEQIEMDYVYEPQGIYIQESKGSLQARLQAVMAQFSGAPWLDPMKFFDKEMQTMGEDPTSYKFNPEEMQQMIVANNMINKPQPPMGPMGQGPMMPQEQMPMPMAGMNNAPPA